jgi:CubicO group peptidase (beta-lactamase class C family)
MSNFQRNAPLLFLAVLLTAPPQRSAIPTDSEISARVDAYAQAQVRVNGFSGSLLVARQGKPLVAKGYGWANAEWEIPNTPSTKFRIGSITKQFTSMVMLQLQQQGKLKVQDPLCQYVTPCPDTWKPITLHHLLTHTSGIPSYTGLQSVMKTNMLPRTTDEVVAAFRDLPLEFEPGKRFAYNNSGYFLLGLVIERVTGKKYDQVVREQIFEPLGMKDSGYDTPDVVIPHRASGYGRRGGMVVNAPYLDMMLPYSAGALYSTVEDLLKWDQALYTDTLLPATAREALFTPFLNDYAYGWVVRGPLPQTFGRRQAAHAGGINGFTSMIIRVLDDNITSIVLANTSAAESARIARDILAITLGEPYEAPKEREKDDTGRKVQ